MFGSTLVWGIYSGGDVKRMEPCDEGKWACNNTICCLLLEVDGKIGLGSRF